MLKFLTIGYGDEQGYKATDKTIRDRAHAHDARLVENGAVVGIAGAPVQVRNPEGKGVRQQPGAFLHSELPVAGFALIEAESLEDAVNLAAQTPCAVAHGVVEVWPLLD